MEVTPQIAVLVLLLVPGLLGHAVFCAFTYTATPSWSGRTVVAILISVASYTSLALLRDWSFLSWLPDPATLVDAADSGLAGLLSTNSLLCVIVASVLALVYSLLLVACHNHRTIYRFAHLIRLTTKTGFVSEWDSAMILRARERWVMVLMKDGTAFTGWLESHDVASNRRAIVMSKIREYDNEGHNFEWPADELLYINGLDEVRALRLIPNKESSDGATASAEATAASTEGGDSLREYESQSGAPGTSADFPNKAAATVQSNRSVITSKSKMECPNV